MSPARIRKRKNPDGSISFQIVYRRGGRDETVQSAGTFRGWPGGKKKIRPSDREYVPAPAVSAAENDARKRRDIVGGWLAQGLDPKAELDKLLTPEPRGTLYDAFTRYEDSRIDVVDKTKSLYRNARDRLGRLKTMDPHQVTSADVRDWIADLVAQPLKPKTVRHYVGTLRSVLDYCDIEPNPARSPKVKLPRQIKGDVNPPDHPAWHALRVRVSAKYLLPVRLMECCGLRVTETVTLAYGDIDFSECRVRISKAKTKGGTAGQRWVPVPVELLDEIADRVPLEDRSYDRPVFPGLTDYGARAAIDRACKLAGIAHYHPHDLRHRRASLWIRHQIDPVTAQSWGGWATASTLLDTYAHVVIDPLGDEWRTFWLEAYAARIPRHVRDAAAATQGDDPL